ncbi:MAG TPA: isoprenylcysteine carboxylmethyltransferase family protein [Polyangiaceae bacterium]
MAKAPGLVLKLVGGVVSSVVIFGGLLFLGAWTLHWVRAWVFVGVVFVASATTMFGIFPNRPDLLDERYKAPVQREQPVADAVVTLLLGGSFFALILFIPLDVFHFHLLGGIRVEVAAVGLLLFAGGWTLLALALRENAFAAPVVKLQQERGQFVVQTGPYRFVRHPMYAGAIPLMTGMPLWLGSVAGVLLAAVPLTFIVLRLLIEERVLRAELPGYADYARKVRWRLVPFVW